SIISPTDGECITTSTVSVDASSDGGELVSCTIDGVSPISVPGSWTSVGEGSHTVECTSTDACGNDSLPASITVTVDTVLPVVSIISPTDGECINSSTVSVDASSDGGELVSCTIDGVSTIVVPGSWVGILDGPHTIECWATDDCGNPGLASVGFMVDTVVNNVVLSTPISGSCINSTVVSVTGTAWDTESGLLQVEITASGPGVFSATAPDFSAPIDLSITTDGVYEISATAWDNCGNSLTSGPLTGVRVDTVIPDITISFPSAGTTVYSSTVVIIGTASDDIGLADVVVGLEGPSVKSQTVSVVAGGWTAIFTGVFKGGYTAVAVATDDCNNTDSAVVVFGVSYPVGLPATIQISADTPAVVISMATVVLKDSFDVGVPGQETSILVTSDRNAPAGVFSDDFESGGLIVGGWTSAGTVSVENRINTLDPGSSWNAYFLAAGEIWRVIDTTGYGNVQVSYQFATHNLEVGENFIFEISVNGGGAWTVVEAFGAGAGETGWQQRDFNLSMLYPFLGVEDNPNFAIRFRQNGNSIADDASDLDNVAVDAVSLTDRVSYIGYTGDGKYIYEVSTCTLGSATLCASWNEGALFTNGLSGNSGCAQVDFVSPTVQIVSPTNGAVLNASNDKDGNPGNGLQYDIAISTDAPDGSTPLATVTVDGYTPLVAPVSGGSITFSGADFPEGLSMTVDVVVDVCSGPGTQEYTVTVDITGPEITITSPTAGSTLFSSNTMIVSGTVSDNLTGVVSVEVNGEEAGLVGLSWTATLVLLDGAHTITVTAVDGAGNSSGSSIGVFIDTVRPVVFLDPLPSLTNQVNLVVGGEVTDPEPGSGVEQVVVIVDGVTPFPALVVGGSFSATITLTGEGLHTVYAEARDKTGNIRISTSRTVVLDTVPPVVVITSPTGGRFGLADDSNGGIPGFQTGVTVSTDAGDGRMVLLQVLAGGVTLERTKLVSGGIANFVDVTLLEGANTLVASVSDLAGNEGISQMVRVEVDLTAPFISISSPQDGALLSTSIIDVVVTTDAELGQTVVLEVNGTTTEEVVGIGLVVFSGVNLVEGANTLVATVEDLAGNVNSSGSVVVFVDTIRPVVLITEPPGAATINETSILVKGTASDPGGSGVDYVMVGSEVAFGQDDWELIVSGLAEGLNIIDIRAYDFAGNETDPPAQVNVFVDTIAPVVSVASPTVGECINTETVVVDGTVTEGGSGVEFIAVMAIGPAVFSVTGSSFPVNLTVTVDGLYSISVEVSDRVGNFSSLVWVSNVRVDITAPEVGIGSPVTDDCIDSSTVV
ncbi:MAG: hypothetical protein JSU92_03740, partial [Deltaproteobacteria bacterium]